MMHALRRALGLVALAAVLPAQSTTCFSLSNNNLFADNISMGGPNLWLAIKAQTGAAPLVATRVEIWTGEGTGANGLSLWSHDAAQNQPLTNLGGAQWSMARINGWQGASFAAPALILPNTTFWIVWAPVNGAQASVEVQTVPNAPSYRGSFDGGQNWSGPFADHLWKYRILCGGQPGHYEVFGSSCSGATRRRPELGFASVPTLAQNSTVLVQGGTPSGNAFLTFGGSSTSWGALALPFDLTPLGGGGCSVLASFDLVVPTTLDGAGLGSVAFGVPNDPSLLGQPFFNQWVVADPGANALQLLLSNGGRARVGN